jgi:hypothetical protein
VRNGQQQQWQQGDEVDDDGNGATGDDVDNDGDSATGDGMR